MNFKERNAHSFPLFHHSKVIKIADIVKIEVCLFMKKYTNNKLLSIFTNWFRFSSMSHNYPGLPLKEIFKSLVSKQHYMEKMLLFIWL